MSIPLLSIILLTHSFVAEETLRSVHAFFRHGDRYPTEDLNIIPGQLDNIILGALTDAGHLRLAGIGEKFRKDAYTKLSETYEFDEATFYATTTDRVEQSAHAFAAGLYKEKGPKKYPENTTCIFANCHQPVPVTSVLKDNEYFMRGNERCPTAAKIGVQTTKTDAYQKKLAPYKSIIELLDKELKRGLSSNPADISQTIDCLLTYKENGIAIPESINAKWDEIMKLFDLTSLIWSPFDNKLFCNASLGVFYRRIVSEMKEDLARKTPDNRPTLHAYFAHGTSLQIILGCLGYDLTIHPRYAGMVVIELWSDGTNDRLVFKLDLAPEKDGTHTLAAWTPTFCKTPADCTIKGFSSGYESVIESETLTQWFYETCGLQTIENNLPLLIVNIVLGACLAVAILVCVLVIIRTMRQSKKPQVV
ncbi:hypothetical protein BLNAU_18618 [Blattamonas nauphoetae]|uniref:Acid phosphatase n=1 Tax=Blattamonas nauphoetae TaxID=2049346 RepID=A0ABQ9X4D1_9EUKA|nr:hypothetical protein BLNAU_18618 [Blattamonas nauphoetae]